MPGNKTPETVNMSQEFKPEAAAAVCKERILMIIGKHEYLCRYKYS